MFNLLQYRTNFDTKTKTYQEESKVVLLWIGENKKDCKMIVNFSKFPQYHFENPNQHSKQTCWPVLTLYIPRLQVQWFIL